MRLITLALSAALCASSVAHAAKNNPSDGNTDAAASGSAAARVLSILEMRQSAGERDTEKRPRLSFNSERSWPGQVGKSLAESTQSIVHTANTITDNALGWLGVKYRFGGNSPETGFDCSGFVRAVYEKTAGLVLPRRSEEQARATQTIDKADLQPGDLVFFNTRQRDYSHVGIYMGDNKFVHAPRSGANVRVENMGISYWQSRFNGARRVSFTQDVDAGTIRR